MVGTALVKSLEHHHLVLPNKQELNITRLSQVMKFGCEFIIHLASETDHEACDENPAQCYLVNVIGTANMTRLAIKLNVPILYLSTASVFDGKKEIPYSTDDKPNPINHYNASKYYGELMVKQTKKHYILRAGWMFGGGPGVDKKFVNKIMDKIKRGDKNIRIADDCIGSPTYTNDLSRFIAKIIDNQKVPFGIYNAANKSNNGISRHSFGLEITRILGQSCKHLVKKCSIDDLKGEFPCKRTNYEVLENSVYMTKDWRKALKEYINAHYRH